ncbi:MAG: glycosyltransferase, partial [Desulfobacterales bacterium]
MIIRIDDYPHGDLYMYKRLKTDPGYDHREHIYAFLQGFEKHGVPYVLGVSPGLMNNESDRFFLRSLRYCEVAMHGYSHGWHEFAETWSAIDASLSQGGEFALASRKTIGDKIKRGLELLGDFKISKFIAPFNVYTQDVLDVLNELGFRTIMGGKETVQFGMDALDHGDLDLDLCLPPFCGESTKVIPHLGEALDEQKTITLHWIFEKPQNLTYWTRIAETVKRKASLIRPSAGSGTAPGANRRLPDLYSPPPGLARDLPIAIVTETMNYVSGGVRCIAEVLNRLKQRGYATTCFVTHSDLRCEWLKVEFPILPATELRQFKGIAISPFSPTAEMVARSNAAAKFYWVHSYEPKFPQLTGRSDRWRIMSEDSYRLDELQYFAVSSYVRMILELFYEREVLSPLVPGGVNTDLFRPGPKSGHPIKIMFLSREHEFRGAHDIVRALQIATERGVEMEVYVMGKPIAMGAIAHKFVPPLPQKEFASLLGSADVFVHASHFEGAPLPPLEAMASKCAVIATYVGAADYLLDGYNALVVPPRKPDKIAAALVRLAGDADLRRKLGEGGWQTVANGYTW